MWLFAAGPTTPPAPGGAPPVPFPGDAKNWVPTPGPSAPPELTNIINQVLGVLKYLGLAACVLGLFVSAIMMAAGRRNRSQLATDGAMGVPWAVMAVSVIVLAPILVSMFL